MLTHIAHAQQHIRLTGEMSLPQVIRSVYTLLNIIVPNRWAKRCQSPAVGKITLKPTLREHQWLQTSADKSLSRCCQPAYIMHEKLTNYLFVAGAGAHSGSGPSHTVGRLANTQI